MGDVAHILGLQSQEPQKSDQNADTSATEATNKSGRKLTGMQREVMGLMESTYRSNHAFYPGFEVQSLQEKWKARRAQPAVKWVKNAFKNPGRDDEESPLVLKHWEKSTYSGNEYPFARFNVRCDVAHYTDEEYRACIEVITDSNMKTWNRAQTDELFQLCQRYDLRWWVIGDRFFASQQSQNMNVEDWSVEDLKYRYYTLERLLARYRTDGNTGSADVRNGATENALVIDPEYSFNVLHEKQRKLHLERAFEITREEEKEITVLTEELRELEQQLKKTVLKVDTKKRKDLAALLYERSRDLPIGVFLRSATLELPRTKPALLSVKMSQKLGHVLSELSIPPRPIPTKSVCDMYDALRKDIIGLLTLRKYLNQSNKELEVLRNRYKSVTGETYHGGSCGPLQQPDLDCTMRQGNVFDSEGDARNAASGAINSDSEKGNKPPGKTFRNAAKRRLSGASGVGYKRNKKIL